MRRLNPTVLYVITGVLALLLVAYVFAGGSRDNPDRLGAKEVSRPSETDPEKHCGSPQTQDLIKRELFRRAAQVRGSDQATFDKIPAYSTLRVGSPELRNHDEDAGAIGCSGSLALDLPQGVVAVGGNRTLNANIGYVVQPAADGSGPVVTLSDADAIIATLATIASTEQEARRSDTPVSRTNAAQETVTPSSTNRPQPKRREPTPPAPPKTVRKTTTISSPPPATPPPATASPSFNCRHARTRGEVAVCNDAGLAALDRQMASQFDAGMRSGDREQRALLQRTRGPFLSYRDRCGSNQCIAETYRSRMREISDIMANRWQPH